MDDEVIIVICLNVSKIAVGLLAASSMLHTAHAASNETTIVTKSERNGQTSIDYSFFDSSFDYDADRPNVQTRSFCYFGQASDVCSKIKQDIDDLMEDYDNGNSHDGLELSSCSVSPLEDRAVIQYRLFDDYGGDIDLTRDVLPCGSDTPPPAHDYSEY